MNARCTWSHAVLLTLVLMFVAGNAHALTVHDLKGQHFEANYGTYAPHGDCKREPKITVDESGFTFEYRGKQIHPGTFEWAVTYFGPEYQGIANYFFPFPVSDSDYGRVGMTVNPGEKRGTLKFEPNLGPGQSLNALQAALVHGSPYAKCGMQVAAAPSAKSAPQPTGPAAAAGAVKIDFSKDAIKPTPAQTAAIRRAAASDIKEFNHPEREGYSVATADLDDDGRPDMLVQYSDSAFCGSSGCSGLIVMATPHGYSAKAIGLPNFYGEIDVLASKHGGMHDLQYGDSPVWKWDGKEYRIDKADVPGSGAPPWQTRNAAGRTLAMTVAIDSVIKDVTVFCNQGKPVLAMLAKARPPSGPVTLTFVFRGWTVNVPMSQGNRDATLWLADLSGSQLPQWLAHRGTDPTTRKLARAADMAFLRINGGMQGQISLKGSTQATQAALGGCYRY